MQTITVSKDDLLTTLKANLEEHQNTFDRAQEQYRQRIIEALDRRLQDARDGKRISTYINLPEPVNYTEEYRTAIAMVEWAVGDTVDLTQRDFERYVLNKWEWTANFAANTTMYITDEQEEK